jgi:hypothetical protein
MKNLLTLSLLFLIAVSCGKLTPGPYTLSGRLLNNCDEQAPVANRELYFLVDWDEEEANRFATTDAQGNFTYRFDGPPNNSSLIGGSIRLSNENVVLAGIPNLSLAKETNVGVLYTSTPREVAVTFTIQGSGYSNKDTLILATGFHPDLRRRAIKKIAGPFNGLSITENWLRYASSGSNTMSSYANISHPFARRLNGTFGTMCRWQVVQEGDVLGSVEKESALLAACETTAQLNISIPPKGQ